MLCLSESACAGGHSRCPSPFHEARCRLVCETWCHARLLQTRNPKPCFALPRLQASIPYFRSGLKGVARSMPTSAALDRYCQPLWVGLG